MDPPPTLLLGDYYLRYKKIPLFTIPGQPSNEAYTILHEIGYATDAHYEELYPTYPRPSRKTFNLKAQQFQEPWVFSCSHSHLSTYVDVYKAWAKDQASNNDVSLACMCVCVCVCRGGELPWKHQLKPFCFMLRL